MKTPKKLIKRLSAVLMAGIMFAGAAAVRAEGVPSVSASSALLLDAGSGRVIFEKDADTERPMASTTKIMTLLVALKYGNPSDIVTFSSYASKEPDVQLNALKGEK
ncbi:MAG: D-alanyl-D-alanine carboxypeptidase, partial [Firmicutes bacterium]|nr:D-alanyl-D-alanine carboxypeptidase [Bacillota bacterium]